MLAVAAGLTLAQAEDTRAQSLTDLSTLPTVGSVVRPGDLRDHLTSSTPGVGTLGGRAFTVTTSIDVQELATDNAFNSAGGKPSADFITTIQPSLGISAETRRFQGNFTYAPTINVYARNSSQSYVGQNFTGGGLATLVPDLLFLDVRGFASVQSARSGNGPNNTTTLDRQNQTQTTSFSASPYISHRFGGTGTFEAGYTISYNANSGVTGLNSNSVIPSAQLGLLTPNTTNGLNTNSNYVSNSERASFTTGEDFGRITHRLAVTATQYTGNGIYQGAYRSLQTYDVGYAVSRFITALAEIGHESIHYGGAPPVRINDAVWNVGAKLAPNPQSALTLTYGHHDGADAVTFDGRYDATARLRLYARYTEGLSTSSEDLSNALAAVDTTQPGGLFGSNGAPLNLSDNFFGLQNNLYRLKRFSGTASLVYDRDIFSFTATRQTRSVISSASAAVPGASDKGTYGSISWTHELNPNLQSNAFFQYGTYSSAATSTTPGTTSNDSIVASVSLSYMLSETLRTTAQYSFSKNSAGTIGQSSTQNAVLVGVHKQF